MKIFRTIKVCHSRGIGVIQFGIISTNIELDKMFKLRHDVYVEEKKYIPRGHYIEEKDIDDHDKRGECVYFIAVVNGDIIGTARIIKCNPLPVFQDYFSFEEPRELVLFPSDKKIEIGRIISRPHKFLNFEIPRHIIMLGIFSTMAEYAKIQGIEAGYGAIKSSALIKYEKLGVPIYRIKKYEQIYSSQNSNDPLKNFFDSQDPPVPVYYLRSKIETFSHSFFTNDILFIQEKPGVYLSNHHTLSMIKKIRLFIFHKMLMFKLHYAS